VFTVNRPGLSGRALSNESADVGRQLGAEAIADTGTNLTHIYITQDSRQLREVESRLLEAWL